MSLDKVNLQTGRFKYNDGGWYVGQHCGDGKRHGSGIYTYPNGDVFDGSFVMGKREGQGSYKYSAGGQYVGEWKNDCMHGKGKFVYRSGNVYEGEWSNDVPHGRGIFMEGNVIYDIEHDNGTETLRQRNDSKTAAHAGQQGGGGGWFSAFNFCGPTNGPGPCGGGRKD